MASLQFVPHPGAAVQSFPLHKRITTIGKSPDNDVSLLQADLLDVHAHIYFDGSHFTLSSMSKAAALCVNGKKVKAERLRHQDRIRLGEIELTFLLQDPCLIDESEKEKARLEAYRKMVEFCQRLSANNALEDLLTTLLDSVTELTGADKGMVILLEGGKLQVKAARNIHKENIEDAVQKVSDSIIARVIQTRQPIIVSDALNDDQWKTSASVMNLKLCSVMAVPLLEKGNLFGILYLGNDNVVNLFEERSLEILTLFAAQASLLLQNALLLNELKLDNQELSQRLERMRFGEIIGACDPMRQVFRLIEKVAPTDVSVLIQGETGTGKELVARRVHEMSPRSKGPFVIIHCGAIPENLLESELFGHVRGAFTGAVATRIGKFQAAHGGTLFLDEIGELSTHLQVKLLRALQEKAVTKIGDNRLEEVDIRIVSATNRDLDRAIKDGGFREDLFFRLNVIGIHLPPLRDRGDDGITLAKYLLEKYVKEFDKRVRGFTPGAICAMRQYGWPGNIREMENRLKKAVVLADKALLTPEDLDLHREEIEPVHPLAQAKDDFQRRYINEVLLRNNGNRTKTAKDLGVDPRTIFRHLETERQDMEPN